MYASSLLLVRFLDIFLRGLHQAYTLQLSHQVHVPEFRGILRERLQQSELLWRRVTIVHLDLVGQTLGFLGVLWIFRW